MSKPRYRAFHFVFPALEFNRATDAPLPTELAALAGGLRISARGGIEMVQDDDSVRQSILLLISTRPGERIMRPDYGCYLHRLVFSPNDVTTAGLAIHYVRSAIERWEPRVEILRLDANRNAESPEILDIYLEYRVRATQRIEPLSLAFDLDGGQG
jgi:phage baseplate assembly protein W